MKMLAAFATISDWMSDHDQHAFGYVLAEIA